MSDKKDLKILIAADNTEFNKHKIDIAKKLSPNFSFCNILRNSTGYQDVDWDIVWNASQANAQFELDKVKSKVIINKNAETFVLCGDKWKTYKYLKERDYPQVETSLENDFGYPVIMKYAFGSFGFKVWLVNNRQEENLVLLKLNTTINDAILNGQPHGQIIYQRFVESSAGIDICPYVVGGKVVACMKRENKKDFRSHVFRGGVASKYELPEEVKTMCENIAKDMELDYCSINLFNDAGKYLVCEVNANAGTDVIHQITGVDVVQKAFDWAVEQIKNK